jgi:hypothetical protein
MFESPPRTLTLAELEAFDPQAPAHAPERRFCCPLPACGDKSVDQEHRSLALNVETGLWTCHRCLARGQLAAHWAPPARSRRARSVAAARRAFALSPEHAPTVATATTWRQRWEATRPLADTPGATYVEARGIPLAVAIAAGVRWAPRWYSARPAVVFPVVDRAGELVAASGRFTDGREDPKVQTAGPKSLGVFEACPGALRASPLVVTEAALDALALAACGVPAVAFVGTSPPRWLAAHVALRPVLIALDNDTAGDNATAKLAPALGSLGARCERLRPAPWKDWAEGIAAIGRDALAAMLARVLGTEAPAATCWWDGAPWCGRISEADFRSIIAAYIAEHGYYAPDLPEREPGVLEAWQSLQADDTSAAEEPRAPRSTPRGRLKLSRWTAPEGPPRSRLELQV